MPSLVRLDPGLLEADAVGVRDAPGDEEVRPPDRAARRTQANGLSGSPLDAKDGGPGQDLDPLVPEESLDRLGHVRVFAVDQRAVAESSRERIRCGRNVSAIQAYYKIYGQRRFRVLPNHRLAYEVGGVTITAQPDLWVDENGTQVLLKIGMARHGVTYIEMLLSLLRKAAVKSGYKIRAKNFVYLNVSNGKELICSGPLTRFNRTFVTGAHEIAGVWPTLMAGDA